MADPNGFLKIKRQSAAARSVGERVCDYCEVMISRHPEASRQQAARCMDCGTPFCHWGCPVGNYIPEWNDFVFQGQWPKAWELLSATINFPEFTGRLCPALCEYSCVLGINDDPVTIRENELAIVEYAFRHGLVKSVPPVSRTGKKIAVVGSGPAGLACADQLNKAGHQVFVFERDEKIGGILRFGIPDFKLEKKIIDRRLDILMREGIEFVAGTDIINQEQLKGFDARVLAGGSRVPRDLKIPGRELKGIHFAMDYLTQSNRRLAGKKFSAEQTINARGKKILVIGGGDTGADCVGTAHRQGAAAVNQIEVLSMPADCRNDSQPWPYYPNLLKVSSSHQEGGQRQWAVLTKKFTGDNDQVKKAVCVKVDFSQKDEKLCPIMREIPGSELDIEADLVILAIGFVRPEKTGLLENLKVRLDERQNVFTDENFMTSQKGIFSAGDMRRGQSLIVWAISEGRQAAHRVDRYLMGASNLPMM